MSPLFGPSVMTEDEHKKYNNLSREFAEQIAEKLSSNGNSSNELARLIGQLIYYRRLILGRSREYVEQKSELERGTLMYLEEKIPSPFPLPVVSLILIALEDFEGLKIYTEAYRNVSRTNPYRPVPSLK